MDVDLPQTQIDLLANWVSRWQSGQPNQLAALDEVCP